METRASKKRKVAADAPPPTLASLPLEILDNIVRYLAHDKHTLAQCMRVSSDFNSLVAPTLYREIKFDRTTHSLFQPGRAIKGRKTKGLSFNLAQSKQIQYEYEVHERSRRLKYQSATTHCRIKVPILLYLTSPKAGSHRYSCTCSRNIETRKLVVKWSFPRIPPEDYFGSAKTAVHIFFHANTTYRRFLGDAQSKLAAFREIYVFWSSLPKSATRSSTNYSWDMDSWGALVGDFLFLAKYRKSPWECIFVNIESVVPKLYKQGQRGPVSECDAAAAHLRQQLESIGVRSQFKIKFLSMRDYLKNYDWTGEFADEQVKPWLDLMKQEAEEEERNREQNEV